MAKKEEAKKSDVMFVKGVVVRADHKQRSFQNKQGKTVTEPQEMYHLDIKITSIDNPVLPDDKRYIPDYLTLDDPRGAYCSLKSRYSFPVMFTDCSEALDFEDDIITEKKNLHGVPVVVKMIKNKGNLYPNCAKFNTAYTELSELSTADFSDFGDFDDVPEDFTDLSGEDLPFN